MNTKKAGLSKLFKKTGIAVGIIVISIGAYSFVDNDFKLLKSLDIYYTLFRELNTYYVDETDPEKLVKTSIDGMLESLDPYTVFIPESALDDYEFMTTGEYGGIGASVRKMGHNIVIYDIMENYPAQLAGIKIGDIIKKIDGKTITAKNYNSDIGDLLKGDPQSEIELTVERSNQPKPLKIKMKRQHIVVDNVPYFGLVTKNFGYIRLSNFTTNANLEVKNALLKLKEQGANGIILDLRGNPGGLLMEAVNITNLFIDKGQEVVQTKGKVKQYDYTYLTKNLPVDTKIPVVVLVNRSSASASEIVAGAMQDLDRAVIIGRKTFGKGLVQTTRSLSYNTKLKVTAAKYYIPSGRCIQALDYSHRDPDGEVEYIPDSLKKEYSTKAGRKVLDGGGIQPDIVVNNNPLNRFVRNLYVNNYFFNFATQYALKTDSIAQPVNFSIKDADFNEFIAYLKANKFEYKSETEEALELVKKASEREKYWDMTKDEYNALEEKIKHDIVIDLNINKKEIMDILTEEITGRFYYQKGRIQVSLTSDKYISEAINILNNPDKYTGLLNGTYNPIYANSGVDTEGDNN